MKLGVDILNFGSGTSPKSLRGWAHFAERAGFSIAYRSNVRASAHHGDDSEENG
jgi:hypothetical protein